MGGPSIPPGRRIGVLRALVLLGMAWSATVALPDRADAAVRQLQVGFAEPLFGAAPAVAGTWLERGEEAGGTLARLNVSWAAVAPATRPPGFDPSDPNDAAYTWSGLDAVVRRTTGHGFRAIFTIYDAPRWAEGARRPAAAPPGTWKPRPPALGEFARAIAARYSGTTRDPARPGKNLPRVRLFQAWNEENLSTYLTPQWVGKRAVSPAHYRSMLNAFYAGVHSAQPGATVLTGGTAPYGDLPGGERVPPVTFWHGLLCLGSRLQPLRCSQRAHADVFAHHPINAGSPTTSAASPLDATTPDIGPLRRALNKAIRTGRALPHRSKPIWATEIWWDSSPPDPRGVPLARQARWYQQSLYVLWRQRVSVVIFLQLGDAPASPSYATSSQSGIFFLSGKPKPSRVAVRFPFVMHRLAKRAVSAWGIAPKAGRVSVQRHSRTGWNTVARLHARPHRPFVVRIPLRGGRFRARAGGETSLVWSVR